MFNNLSLKAKLISVCMFIAAFSGIVGIVSFVSMRKVAVNYEHVAKVNLPNTDALGDLETDVRRIRIYMAALALPQLTEEQQKASLSIIDEVKADYVKKDANYNSVPFVEGEQEKYIPVNAAWKKLDVMIEKVRSLALQNTPESKQKIYEIFFGEGKVVSDEYYAALGALNDFQSAESKRWVGQAQSANEMADILIAGISIAAILIAGFAGYLFSLMLSRQLNTLAEGLARGAEEVASASKQISDSGTELSSSATEQAAALQETVASIDEVSAMVNKNAENAKSSQELSTTSEHTATKGKQVVDEMIRSIEEINSSNSQIMQQIETSNREISDIVKVIAEIGNKTKVINDIVFQTKLLSFNASVEAARAGEHGKGFAVVAEEVGNLAQMSGNAAKEISQMLEASIRKVENIVNETKSKVERLIVTGKETVQKGTSTAKRCGEVLDEIVRNVTSLSQMVGEISTASREQATGVQEITIAMGQLDQVTQTNAAASNQSANAAEQLTIQASSLHEMVATLVQTITGKKQDVKTPSGNTHKTAKTSGPVIDFKEKLNNRKPKAEVRSKVATASHSMKKAVGAEDVPSENDPRFSEI